MKTLDQVLEDHMRLAIETAGGNMRQAARLIGISHSKLYRWEKRFNRDLRPAPCERCGSRKDSAICRQGAC
jgi:transposase-like protein